LITTFYNCTVHFGPEWNEPRTDEKAKIVEEQT